MLNKENSTKKTQLKSSSEKAVGVKGRRDASPSTKTTAPSPLVATLLLLFLTC